MIRPRIVVLATTASLALAGAAAPSALAGSHWSEKKCENVYNAWYKAHVNPKKTMTPKQNKQLNAFVEGLEKNHHCELRG